jgi:hypothetical protein
MSVQHLLVILAVALAGCASKPVGDDSIDSETLQSLQPTADLWSPPVNGLALRLRANTIKASPGDAVTAIVHVRATEPDTDHQRLLQGNVVLTFVPVFREGEGETVSVNYHFSGAGGVGYTGDPPLGSFTLTAPAEPGEYNLIATVIATREQVDRFLMLAFIPRGPERWWTGVMSSPAVRLTVQ